jgi:transposase
MPVMANRRISIVDLVELVRLLRAGASDRTLTQVLRHNRRTIARYRAWVQEQGLLEVSRELPSAAALHQLRAATLPTAPPPQQVSSLAAYREQIAAYRARGMEMAAIRTRLEAEHGRPVSYSAVRRLVRRLEPPPPPQVMVRVEVKPGSEAQVDFGYAGLTVDPTSGAARKTWVFVMVLSYSRHLYAELVFDQRIETWLLCHVHAFAFFGGVPARVVPDNLKAAVVRASFTAPEASQAYRECAEHYGFLIDPNPPHTPRLKGKVEQGGVHYVKRNFLTGRSLGPTPDEPPPRCDTLNVALRDWCVQVAGQRRHGTTKQIPLERFRAVEQAALCPLPPTPFDLASWKRVVVGRDCYVTFAQAYYSAPYRLVGQSVWVRGGARTVELYNSDHELVATHDRAQAAGDRVTTLAHLPPEKVPGLLLTRECCQEQAKAMGPATAALVEQLLAHRPEDRLRTAGRLVRLAERASPARLERACARAWAFGSADYPTVKRILLAGLEGAEPGGLPAFPMLPPTPLVAPPPLSARATAPVVLSASTVTPAPSAPAAHPRTYTFMRQASEFVAHLLSAASGGGGTRP